MSEIIEDRRETLRRTEDKFCMGERCTEVRLIRAKINEQNVGQLRYMKLITALGAGILTALSMSTWNLMGIYKSIGELAASVKAVSDSYATIARTVDINSGRILRLEKFIETRPIEDE